MSETMYQLVFTSTGIQYKTKVNKKTFPHLLGAHHLHQQVLLFGR